MRSGRKRIGNKVLFTCSGCAAQREVPVKAGASDSRAEADAEIYMTTQGWKAWGDIRCPKCQVAGENGIVSKPVFGQAEFTDSTWLYKKIQDAVKRREEQ